MYLRLFINTPVQETEGWWKRYAADGMFYASYVAGQDTLQLQALEKMVRNGNQQAAQSIMA